MCNENRVGHLENPIHGKYLRGVTYNMSLKRLPQIPQIAQIGFNNCLHYMAIIF